MPLASRTDCGDARYCGVEVAFACDIVDTLQVGSIILITVQGSMMYRLSRVLCPSLSWTPWELLLSNPLFTLPSPIHR